MTKSSSRTIQTSIGVVTDRTIFIRKVKDCARCGETHRNLTFHRLQRPTPSSTHWCPCPTTAEPILLRQEFQKYLKPKTRKTRGPR